MIVIKFGGTSVKDSVAMTKSLNIVKESINRRPLVVLSACGGITDKLISAIQLSATYEKDKSALLVKDIENHHLQLVDELITDKYYQNLAREKVIALCQNLKTLIDGVSLLEHCTPRSIDSASTFGELLSTTIFELALKSHGINSHFADARDIMKTDSMFTQANITFDKVKVNAKKLCDEFLNKGKVVVIQGFIGSDDEGLTTTLGRGGSDLSAAIFGSAMDAEEIQIWTDVSGVLSADPRIIKDAVTIPEMSFKEVLELSFFGAKVLHPDTIKPAIENKIPVCVLNTFEPDNAGTLILEKTSADLGEINSLVLKKNCTSIGIRLNGLSNINDMIFEVLNDINKINRKVFYHAIANNKINVVLDSNAKEISNDLDNLKSKYDAKISDTSLISLCGQNIVSKQIELKDKLENIFSVINKFNPSSIQFGTTETSIIITLPQDVSETALKELHMEISK